MKHLIIFSLLLASYSVKAQSDSIAQKESVDADTTIFDKADQMPVFPGGEAQMMKFIQKNVQYPSEARAARIMGTCYASYVVEKDGSLTNLKIIKGVAKGAALDDETLRMIRTMPKWTPGKHEGKVVRVRYNLPIRYVL